MHALIDPSAGDVACLWLLLNRQIDSNYISLSLLPILERMWLVFFERERWAKCVDWSGMLNRILNSETIIGGRACLRTWVHVFNRCIYLPDHLSSYLVVIQRGRGD